MRQSKKLGILLLGALCICSLAQASKKNPETRASSLEVPKKEARDSKSSVPAASSEREYLDAKVLSIDSQAGFIRIQFQEEKDSTEKEAALKITVNEVDVTNPAHQSLELSDVAVGDMVDIYTNRGSDGSEQVYEILDYNKVSEEE